MTEKFLLPDNTDERYSWEFVRDIAAKARAHALVEAADLADLYALLDNTKSHDLHIPSEGYSAELRKLAKQAKSGALPNSRGGC